MKVVQVTLVAALVVSLSGCQARSISFSSEDLSLPKCASTQTLSVSDLAQAPEPICDLAGVTLRFPDGHTSTIPAAGESQVDGNASSANYYLANLGTAGVVAVSQASPTSKLSWWGTEVGVKKEKDLYGDGGSPFD